MQYFWLILPMQLADASQVSLTEQFTNELVEDLKHNKKIKDKTNTLKNTLLKFLKIIFIVLLVKSIKDHCAPPPLNCTVSGIRS